MKIVFCKGGFMGPVSGSDEQVISYTTHLLAAGHQPSVLLLNPHSPEDQYYVRLHNGGIPVASITRYPLYTMLRAARKAAACLSDTAEESRHLSWESLAYWTYFYWFKRMRPDLVHVLVPDTSTPIVIGASRAAGVPVLYHELGTPWYASEMTPYYNHLSDVLPLCSALAALSPQLALKCRERFQFLGPLHVIPLMIEGPVASSRASRSRSAEITFGFAARLESWKGPAVLLEAFGLLLREFPCARLRIAGVGPQKEELVREAQCLGIADRCEFIAPYAGLSERSLFMNGLDVFVHPSFAEGTPNSIAEAMAHGLAVVASEVGGIPDMISGESGIVVPAGDVPSLAEALCDLAADPNKLSRMQQAARADYESKFSPPVVLPLLLDTYRRVLDRHERPRAGSPQLVERCRHPWTSQQNEATEV